MSVNDTTSAATRNDIIDRATDGNPTNNAVNLSARDYMQNGGGRFIKPTFASGIREVIGDLRLPRGQTISFTVTVKGTQYSTPPPIRPTLRRAHPSRVTWQERTLAVFPKSLRISEWLDYLRALFAEVSHIVFEGAGIAGIEVCRETRKTLRQQLKTLEYALSAAIELRASALGWDAHEVPSPAPPPPPRAPRAPSVEGAPGRSLRFRRRPDPSLPHKSVPRPQLREPDFHRARTPFVVAAVRRALRCRHALDHFEDYARRLARTTRPSPPPVRNARPLLPPPPQFAPPLRTRPAPGLLPKPDSS